jgi:crotonobetainyl-CoA:carnitine CoA-transferase CaiB-like acyl-CoA transferase
VRILDISEGIAGPYATSLLADIGADVIKVERPDGDWSRFVGRTVAKGLSAMYVAMNRNKRELTVDLKHPDALGLMRRLLSSCDVVVSNYRAGVMERLGLSYDECVAVRPGLVYCTITAFDTRGSYAEVGGNDTGLQAISGFMSMNGQSDGEPMRSATPVIDMVSALFVSQAVLAALRLPEDHPGRRLEVCLLNASAAMQTLAFTEYLNTGEIPERHGNQNPFISPAGAFAGSDGKYFTVSCLKESHWQRLCSVIGRTDLLDEPSYFANADRVRNRTSLNAALERVFGARPTRDWVQLLREHDILCASVNDLEEVVSDPGLGGELPLIDVGSTEPLRTIGHPVGFGGAFPEVHTPVQRIGAGSRETLSQLGHSEEEIDALLDSGAVVSREYEPTTVSAAADHHRHPRNAQAETNASPDL